MSRPKLDKPNYRLRLRGTRWVIDWTENGKPKSLSTGTADRDEAQGKFDQYIAGTEQGERPVNPTISVILDGYLRDREGHVQAYETLAHSVKPIRRHIGNLLPGQLKRRMFWDRRKADGVAAGTIIREGVTLRAALAWAAREEWIEKAPYVALPQRSAPRERWLDRGEADRLIAATKAPHVRLFVLLALHTAARRGAILDLTWDRVDLERRVIQFRKPGRAETKKRRATVPINATLLAALAEAKELAVSDYVVEYHGRKAGNPKKAFERAAQRASIEGCTPHTLRHTAATWMVMARVPLAEVARFLGDTEAMVEKVYGKHSPDYLRNAADALDGIDSTTVKITPGSDGKQPVSTGIVSQEQTE